jgi:hypothetical protein
MFLDISSANTYFLHPYTLREVSKIIYITTFYILLPNSLIKIVVTYSVYGAPWGHTFKCQNFHDFGWIIFVFPLHEFF